MDWLAIVKYMAVSCAVIGSTLKYENTTPRTATSEFISTYSQVVNRPFQMQSTAIASLFKQVSRGQSMTDAISWRRLLAIANIRNAKH